MAILRGSSVPTGTSNQQVPPGGSRDAHRKRSRDHTRRRQGRILALIVALAMVATACTAPTVTATGDRTGTAETQTGAPNEQSAESTTESTTDPAADPTPEQAAVETETETEATETEPTDVPDDATASTPVPVESEPVEFTTRPLGIGPLGIKGDWSKLDIDGPYLDTLGDFGGFFEISWCRIEEEEGTQNWTRLDRVVTNAQELNIALMIKIRVGSCWATGGVAGDSRGERDRRASALPEDMDLYNQFVTDLVTRYLDTSVVAYAIENEVNGGGFWAGTVDEFVVVSEAGARAVRAADPDALIMDSGLSSTTYGSAMAADLLAAGKDELAVDVFNAYYDRRTRRRQDFPVVSSPDELRDVLADGQAARNIAYAEASLDLAQRGVVDAYQLHFYERFNSIPALMDFVNRSVGDAPVYVVEAGIFWQDGDQSALYGESALLVTGLFEHGAVSVTFLPLRSNGEGIRWGLLNPDGDPPPRAELFAQMNQAIQGENARVGVLPLGERTAVILGSDDGAVAIIKDANGQSLAIEVVEGDTPESLAAELDG